MTDILVERDDPTSPGMDTSLDVRYEDQGDGTWAEVIYGDSYGAKAASDILVSQWPSGVVTRYRDMGGFYAEVVYIG